MSAATIHVPERRSTSDFVVDARVWQPRRRPKPTGCRYCGGPASDPTPPLYCSKARCIAAVTQRY